MLPMYSVPISKKIFPKLYINCTTDKFQTLKYKSDISSNTFTHHYFNTNVALKYPVSVFAKVGRRPQTFKDHINDQL